MARKKTLKGRLRDINQWYKDNVSPKTRARIATSIKAFFTAFFGVLIPIITLSLSSPGFTLEAFIAVIMAGIPGALAAALNAAWKELRGHYSYLNSQETKWEAAKSAE